MNLFDENRIMVNRALSFIQSNIRDDMLTLEQVAEQAGFCTDYFNRIFLEFTGYNVIEYARFCRLRRAAYTLRSTDRRILDIAVEFGYSSQEAFSRAFARQYGMTPADYRKKMREKVCRWADVMADTTYQKGFLVDHPDFISVDRDAVIDFILDLNYAKFAYSAVSIDWNGSFVFTDEEKLETESDFDFISRVGDFVAVDTYPDLTHYYFVHLRHPGKLVRYLDLIGNEACGVEFEDKMTVDEIRSFLVGSNYEHSEFKIIPGFVFTETERPFPTVPEGFDIHLLTEEDIPSLSGFENTAPVNQLWKTSHRAQEVLESKDVKGERYIGLFEGKDLVAIASLFYQETHGAQVNNCIYVDVCEKHRNNETFRLLYDWCTSFIIKDNFLPFDDQQTGIFAEKNGDFTPDVFGYRKVGEVFCFDFRK